METIIVRSSTRWPPNPASLVIARATGSRTWSHTMNIVGDRAFEASMTHGCRVVPVAEAMQGIVAYQDMYVPVPNLAAAVEFGEKQDKKPYDWAGALGLPFLMSEDWADASRWWCSELCFAMLGAGGLWVFDPRVAKRVTPDHLTLCNFPKSPIVRLNNDPPRAGFFSS